MTTSTRKYVLRRTSGPLPGSGAAPLAPGAKPEDDIDAIISRNLGFQRERHGFRPAAGPNDPPELDAYLARRADLIAIQEETDCDGHLEGPGAFGIYSRLSLAARDLVARISATPGGRLDAQGYRYTIGDRGGIQIEQL